jgi:hypothetical protein
MKVQFLKDTAKAIVKDPPDNTLVVYRDGFGYGLPKIDGAEYIEFLEYKNKYMMFEPALLVVVGLNRIITPSNRCDFVNEFMQTMTPNVPKISIDTAPFIGEPWRLWFHYSVANCGRFNINYSFAIETEWEHWFYRDVMDCRLSKDNIRLFISDTVSNMEPLRTRFEFREPDPDEDKWYAQAKETVFEKYDTPKLLINNLLKLANRHFGLDISYDSYRTAARPTLFDAGDAIVVPDIGIYRFMVEENLRRMGTYNEVVSYESISQ